MNKVGLVICVWALLAIFLDYFGDSWTRNLMVGGMPTIMFDFKDGIGTLYTLDIIVTVAVAFLAIQLVGMLLLPVRLFMMALKG